MPESRSGDRLDALDAKVDRVALDLREHRKETRADLKEHRKEMREGFDQVNSRFDSLYRLMLAGGIGIIAALIGLLQF